MDPSDFSALAKRLMSDAQDKEALVAVQALGLADPGMYALLLEKVAYGTDDPRLASYWFVEAAAVWSTTLGDMRRSGALLQKALENDPWNSRAAERLAHHHQSNNDVGALRSALERRAAACASRLTDDPDRKTEVSQMYAEIGRLWNTGEGARPDRSLAAYERALSLDPSNLETVRNARQIHLGAHRWTEVIAMFEMERAKVLDPAEQARLFHEEAQVRQMAGDGPGAVQALRLAKECDESDLDLVEELANAILTRVVQGENVSTADRLEAAGHFTALAETYEGEIALSHALHALSVDPGGEKAMGLAGQIATSLGQETVLPPYWVAYLTANPDGTHAVPIRELLAAVYEEAGRLDDAIETLLPAESSSPTVGERLAVLFEKTGRVNEAAARMSQQAATLPAEERFDMALKTARLLARNGDVEGAVAHYKEVLAVHPGLLEAVQHVTDSLRQRQQHAELRDVLITAARYSKTPTDARHAMLREASQLCELLGDVDRSLDIMSELSESGDDTVRLHLKHVLEQAGRWDALVRILERELGASNSAEKSATTLRELADIHENKRNDIGKAAGCWARVAKLVPGDQAALLAAVRLYEKEKKPDYAASILASGVPRIEDETARARLYGHLGDLCEKLGEFEQAGDAYASQAEISQSPEAWNAAERCFVTAKLWDKAADVVAKGSDLFTDPVMIASMRARQAEHLAQAGHQDLSIACLEEACELDPTAEVYVSELERHHEDSGHLDRFVDFLLRCANSLDEGPKRVGLRKRAAHLLLDRIGDRNAAIETLYKVLEDEEDPEVLEELIRDAERGQRFEEVCTLLSRREAALSEPSEKAAVALQQARTRARSVGDADGAVGIYERVLREIDPENQEAIDELVALQTGRSNWAGVASALEHAQSVARGDESRLQIALRRADLYEGHLNDPAQTIAALRIVHEINPEDRSIVGRLVHLHEANGEWKPLADLLTLLVTTETDSEKASALTRKQATLLEEKLGQPDEGLAVLERRAEAGDASCHDAYVRMADRLGRGAATARRLERWAGVSEDTQAATQALIGAFDRYMAGGLLHDAARVGRTIPPSESSLIDMARRLEHVATALKNFEVLQIAQGLLLGTLSGVDRAREVVRQAEAAASAGADRAHVVRVAEAELASLAPTEAEGLLERLAALTSTPEERFGLYERQVDRTVDTDARIAAVVQAVRAAARCGLASRCKALFAAGVSSSFEDAGIRLLEQVATDSDRELGGTEMRRAFLEALGDEASAASRGEARRASLLRHAARLAYRDLGDTAQALDWFNESLFARIESALVGSLERLESQVQRLETSVAEMRRTIDKLAHSADALSPSQRQTPQSRPAQTQAQHHPEQPVPQSRPAPQQISQPQTPPQPAPQRPLHRPNIFPGGEESPPSSASAPKPPPAQPTPEQHAAPVFVDLQLDDDDAEPVRPSRPDGLGPDAAKGAGRPSSPAGRASSPDLSARGPSPEIVGRGSSPDIERLGARRPALSWEMLKRGAHRKAAVKEESLTGENHVTAETQDNSQEDKDTKREQADLPPDDKSEELPTRVVSLVAFAAKSERSFPSQPSQSTTQRASSDPGSSGTTPATPGGSKS